MNPLELLEVSTQISPVGGGQRPTIGHGMGCDEEVWNEVFAWTSRITVFSEYGTCETSCLHTCWCQKNTKGVKDPVEFFTTLHDREKLGGHDITDHQGTFSSCFSQAVHPSFRICFTLIDSDQDR